jgi:hypothetical protein
VPLKSSRRAWREKLILTFLALKTPIDMRVVVFFMDEEDVYVVDSNEFPIKRKTGS